MSRCSPAFHDLEISEQNLFDQAVQVETRVNTTSRVGNRGALKSPQDKGQQVGFTAPSNRPGVQTVAEKARELDDFDGSRYRFTGLEHFCKEVEAGVRNLQDHDAVGAKTLRGSIPRGAQFCDRRKDGLDSRARQSNQCDLHRRIILARIMHEI